MAAKKEQKEIDTTKPKTVNKPKPKAGKPVKTPDTTLGLFNSKAKEDTSQKEKDPTIELLAEISGQVFNTENIEAKTVLTKRQVVAFGRAKLYSQIYNIPVVAEMVKTLSIYNISESGLSRKQLVSISQSVLSYTRDQQEQKSLPKHLMGIE